MGCLLGGGSITYVDQYLIQDAEVRKYYLEIRYNAIIPFLSSTKTVNPEIGIRATSGGRPNLGATPVQNDR